MSKRSSCPVCRHPPEFCNLASNRNEFNSQYGCMYYTVYTASVACDCMYYMDFMSADFRYYNLLFTTPGVGVYAKQI